MKKLCLHIILLSYTVLMLKPVLPYVSDFVGHVFFYAHHMATVHYENGKYHVHYDIAQSNKEDQSNKSTVPNQKKDNSNEHIVAVFITPQPYNAYLSIQYISAVTPDVLSGNLKINYPPPRS